MFPQLDFALRFNLVKVVNLCTLCELLLFEFIGITQLQNIGKPLPGYPGKWGYPILMQTKM